MSSKGVLYWEAVIYAHVYQVARKYLLHFEYSVTVATSGSGNKLALVVYVRWSDGDVLMGITGHIWDVDLMARTGGAHAYIDAWVHENIDRELALYLGERAATQLATLS